MWGSIPPTSLAKVCTVLDRPLRRVLGAHVPVPEGQHRLTSMEVRRQAGAASGLAKLVAARLRYVCRASRHGSQLLKAALQSSGGQSWREEVTKAVEVLWQLLPAKLAELPCPSDPGALAVWEALWTAHPGAWCGYVRALLRVAAEQPTRFHEAGQAVYGNGVEVESDEELLRGACEQIFPNRLALAVHRTHKHGVRCEARWFVAGAVCPVCSGNYQSRLRCLRHVQRSQGCKLALQSGCIPRLAADVVAATDDMDRAERRQASHSGVSVMSGLPFVPGPRE